MHLKSLPQQVDDNPLTIDPATYVVKFDLNRWSQCTPITTYIFTICSPTTKTWWIVRKRFSACFAFRKELLQLKALSQPIANILEPMTKIRFPRRKIQGDNDEIKAERTKGLKLFTLILAEARSKCMAQVAHSSPSNEILTDLETLYVALTEFLQVPELQLQEEVRHLLATIAPKPRHETLGCEEDFNFECPICLDDMHAEDMLQLQCGHSFHRECVDDWTKRNYTCPICRTMSYDESYIPVCTIHAILEPSHESFLMRLRNCQTYAEDIRHTPILPSNAPQLIEHPHVCDNICSICMESIESSSFQLQCGHPFHSHCISGWLNTRPTCPVCRQFSSQGFLS